MITAQRYHCGERWQAALVKLGHKHMHCVIIDGSGVRVVSEPREFEHHLLPLLQNGTPYPVGRFVKQLRRVGRARGITEAAKAIVDEAEAELGAGAEGAL